MTTAPMTCPTCGLDLQCSPYTPDRQRGQAGPSPCYLCTAFPIVQALAVDRAKLLHDLQDIVAYHMTSSGIPKRLRTATWEGTTPEIKDKILNEDAQTFARGGVPTKGWGLIGKPGIGKSGALAALAARNLKNTLARKITQYCGEGVSLPPNQLIWVDWPDVFAHLQSHAIDPETPTLIDHVKRAKVLILDDLCRERFPKDSTDRVSFGHDALFQVINHRNGQGAPTLWTSNFSIEALMECYGPPIVTRLIEDNLPIELDSTVNRRLA